MNKKQCNTNKGFALLLALIISSIALSIGLSMLHITLKQLALGTTTKGSEVAFQATNAGMECLQYIRNRQSAEIQAGEDITLECLGGGLIISNSGTDTNHRIYRNNQIGWSTPEGELCIGMEMHLLDAGSDEVTYDFGNGEKKCPVGDVCTFGFVQGYNRSCSDVSNNSIFTVQRELTVEF